MFTNRRWWLHYLLAAVVMALLSGGLIEAGKRHKPGGGGGGGPVPPGRIVYTLWSSYGDPNYAYQGQWSMNGDGSDKRLLNLPDFVSDLSQNLHQGHRWYLVSPHGTTLAVRDDADPNFTVEITEDLWTDYPRWAKDDSFLYFSRIEYDSENDVQIVEIWGAPVAFDEVTGEPSLTMPPALILSNPDANVEICDFSPTGDEVVFHLSDRDGMPYPGLWIKDFVTGATRLLTATGSYPIWSPDGTRILFNRNGGISVINTDGSALTALTNPPSGGDFRGDWSPDSTHVLFRRSFTETKRKTTLYSADILRLSLTDGTTLNLTSDIGGIATAAFWR